MRREESAFQPRDERRVDGAVLGPDAFVIRFFEGTADGTRDRLLVVNFGRDLHLDQAPEPLLGAPENHRWAIHWSSESRDFGGLGTPAVETLDGWRIMGEAAVVLAPEPLPKTDSNAAFQAATERAKERKRSERATMP
jgi:maltooligosyltrehalose trehalohydrolase